MNNMYWLLDLFNIVSLIW